jgi:hypothetical protein
MFFELTVETAILKEQLKMKEALKEVEKDSSANGMK